MKQALYGLAAGLLIAALAVAIYQYRPAPPSGGDSVPAARAPELKRAPVANVTIKAPVKAFEGDTKKKLKLPEAVQANKDEQVIAASEVKSDLRPQTVSTVVNTETGEVQQFVKVEPYPWFAIEPRGAVGIAYGYKFKSLLPDAHAVTRLKLDYDVVRVKALTVGVTGTVDTDRDAFVGVGVTYRW